MKATPFSIFVSLFMCAITFSTLNAAPREKSESKSERKTVTLINAESSADGRSEISRETIKECIVSLPKTEALEAQITSDSRFLKEINGEASKNEWVKTINAHITINYIIYRKELLIVATRSIEGKAPEMKEVEKHLPQVKEFSSNAADGDTYAGRSNRQYYFTKTDDAVKDVKGRAQVWLKQQAPLLCSETK